MTWMNDTVTLVIWCITFVVLNCLWIYWLLESRGLRIRCRRLKTELDELWRRKTETEGEFYLLRRKYNELLEQTKDEQELEDGENYVRRSLGLAVEEKESA